MSELKKLVAEELALPVDPRVERDGQGDCQKHGKAADR